jgi:choline-sulfatase
MKDAPNVILCTCDQLRAFEVGCYGHPVVQTPAMDRLAAEGTRFETAVSNNPVCVPARSSIISGQYSRTCVGALGNDAEHYPPPERTRLLDPTIAEHFKAAGYRTGLIGKWHMHPHPDLCGFDETLFPYAVHKYEGQTYYRGTQEQFVVDEYAGDFEARAAKEFVSRRQKTGDRSEPFFLFYNIGLPHQPIWEGVPEKYRAMYSPDDVVLRDNVARDGSHDDPDFWFKVYAYVDFFWEWLSHRRGETSEFNAERYPLPSDPFTIRELTALYYGSVSAVDDQLGALISALEAAGEWENTVVLFTSDHGDNLGSHGLYNKGLLIEESIRVPLIVRDPRYPSHENTQQIAQLIDIFPTLASLASLSDPKHVQGRNLAPIVRGEATEISPNHAFVENQRHEVGVRVPGALHGALLDEQNRDLANQYSLYYDLVKDPAELDNLAGKTSLPAAAEDTAKLLKDWNTQTPWFKSGA